MSIATLPPPPSPAAKKRATIDDLYRVEGKAELINGEVVELGMTGFTPAMVSGYIFRKLDDFVDSTGRGFAATDGLGFRIPESPEGRESFAPDCSYCDWEKPRGSMKFVEGAPTLAVEVRSENDYGKTPEREMADKRAEYFEAGTKVVWDVDPVNEVIRVYKAASPTTPEEYRAGQFAEAEPALPGWTLDVEWLFRKAKG